MAAHFSTTIEAPQIIVPLSGSTLCSASYWIHFTANTIYRYVFNIRKKFWDVLFEFLLYTKVKRCNLWPLLFDFCSRRDIFRHLNESQKRIFHRLLLFCFLCKSPLWGLAEQAEQQKKWGSPFVLFSWPSMQNRAFSRWFLMKKESLQFPMGEPKGEKIIKRPWSNGMNCRQMKIFFCSEMGNSCAPGHP